MSEEVNENKLSWSLKPVCPQTLIKIQYYLICTPCRIVYDCVVIFSNNTQILNVYTVTYIFIIVSFLTHVGVAEFL